MSLHVQLAPIIKQFSNGDGVHDTAIAGLRCIHLSEVNANLPSVYNPSVCFIAQGSKDVLLQKEIFRYVPSQFLAVSVDLPVIGRVTKASLSEPYLCMQIDLDLNMLAELMMQTRMFAQEPASPARGIFVGDVDDALGDCVLRLAKLLQSPGDIVPLAPVIKRELHYRLLSGAYGGEIAQLARTGSRMQRISEVIQKLRQQYHETLRVEDMAGWAGMSVSSFHTHFKNVTAMSPLQFQKQLRLMEARRIMIAEKSDAASAAYRVGYESPAQFSREYTRLFGNPPRRDVEALRGLQAQH